MAAQLYRLAASVWESLRMALDSLRAHKMRAILTLIGVIIGVATIIALMTVLGGIKHKIDDAMKNSLGVNVFQVQRNDPSGGFQIGRRRREWRPKITKEYAVALRERCPSVKAVGAEAWTFGRTYSRGGIETSPDQQFAGGTVEFAENNAMYIGRGRPITQQDMASARRVIVLGHDAYKQLFQYMDPIGEFIRVEGQRFEVVGVFEERGRLLGENQDAYSWMPLSTFQRIYGDRRSINLTIQAFSAGVFEDAQQEVIEAMRVERGLRPGQPNNFGLWTPDLLQRQFNQQTAWIGIAGFGICAISLLVAGIGIMNIMLVSVTERTREIGVRKALGGTRTSILRQFLIEAVILSEAGGVTGILLGYGSAIAINAQLDFPAPVPTWAVILAIIFCSVVGIGFGMWPAVKASRLDPIEALRHE